MNQLHESMKTVIQDRVEGDFIETGVRRGGACIFMRGFHQIQDPLIQSDYYGAYWRKSK